MNLPLKRIEQIRADTPGLEGKLHFMAAGAALMPHQVLTAVQNHLALEMQIGGYAAAAEMDIDRLYEKIGRLINAHPRNIAFVPNATEAWCRAFYALPLRPNQRILTCEAEYAANHVALIQKAKRDNVKIECVPSDASGQLDLEAFDTMLDEDVGLISLTWVPTNGGLVNPAAEVGKRAQAYGIPYLLDACQAVGQFPIDVQALGCDFLSATGRKFLRGPRGTGFLYVADSWLHKLEPTMIDHFAAPLMDANSYELRPDARRFETWESPYALRAGLEAAVDLALCLGAEAIFQRIGKLSRQMRTGLAHIPGVHLHDLGVDPCGIVSFNHPAATEPQQWVALLQAQNIYIGASKPSSTFFDSQRRSLPALFRASPHYYNSEDEVDRFVEAFAQLAKMASKGA